MSYQYTAPGLEPMTFQTLVVSHNHLTRKLLVVVVLVWHSVKAGYLVA